MLNRIWKTLGIYCLCTVILAAVPETAMAEETSPKKQTGVPVVVRVEQSAADAYAEPDAGDAEKEADTDGEETKEIEETAEGAEETAESEEEVTEIIEETAEETAARESAEKREEIVDYAMQFLGNKYVYGGTNPNKGVDCSGFTSYVMKNAGGVQLSHSSRAQSREGKVISLDEARPGDLIFYGNGSGINHVALYIGDGEIVHASNEINGILISDCTYRKPIKVVNVLGD